MLNEDRSEKSYRSLIDFGLNGKKALTEVIVKSTYQSIEQAIASLTIFSHPDTVKQTRNKNVFKIIRDPQNRGEYAELENIGKVLKDDNKGPTETFIWANEIKKSQYKDIQFCHIWTDSTNVELYTSLANICIVPAFLAKLTDNDENVKKLLRYRSYELYNKFCPQGKNKPVKPQSYDKIVWPVTLSAINNLENAY